MSALNLRALVIEVIRDADSVEYADLADTVMARLNGRDLRDALAQALPAYVRSVGVSQRQTGAVRPPSTGPAMPGSWKVQAIRDGWQRSLDEIRATESGNKRLRDFTYDDLMFQAKTCEDLARANRLASRGWSNFADCLKEHGVATVGELPAEILMTTLGAVA